MTLLNKILVFIIAILLTIATFFYIKYLNANDDLKKEKITSTILNQNSIALKEKIQQKEDSLQNLAIFVEDLNSKNNKIKDQYTILLGEFKSAKDSIRILKQHTIATVDSDSVYVPFNGKKNKITYIGHTVYYFKDKEAFYSIEFTIDETKYSYRLYEDEKTKIFRLEVYADNVKIYDVDTKMDSIIYIKTNSSLNNVIPAKKGFFDKLGLYASIQLNNFDYTNIKNTRYFTANNELFDIVFGAYYDFTDDLGLSLENGLLNHTVSMNLQYKFSIKKIIRIL